MADSFDIERAEVEPVNSAKLRQPLYAPRKKVFPKRANGTFRRFKWLVMAITLGIYYLTPWLRWDRGPHAPDQAVLIDLANRRFYFFFIEIWPQEFIYIAGLLIMAGIGLFLITSTVGRAWCGYTCPQTVWVDLFLVVERAVEGDRNARIKLDQAPWSARKVWLRTVKHVIWLVIAVATGGAWIFYFADAPTLLVDVVTGHAEPVAYITIGILTATTYTFGGLMREQVCTYMCPWPRIQAAMLDEHSLTVTYNDWRGEPARATPARRSPPARRWATASTATPAWPSARWASTSGRGNSSNASPARCASTPATGVMDKIGKERGLISYATLNDYNANMALATAGNTTAIDPHKVRGADGRFAPGLAHFHIRRIFRPRTFSISASGRWSAFCCCSRCSAATGWRSTFCTTATRNTCCSRRVDPQRLYGQAAQHDPAAPHARRLHRRSRRRHHEPGRGRGIGGTVFRGRRRSRQAQGPQDLRPAAAGKVEDEVQTFHFAVEDKDGHETDRYKAKFNGPEDGK